MTVFKHLFTKLFNLKSKGAYALLLIQCIGVLVLSILTFDNQGAKYMPNGTYLGNINITYFFSGLLAIYLVFVLFFSLVFYLITCIQNERFNRSPTLRLTPISDPLFYLDNMLSSLATMGYYLLLAILPALFVYGLSLFLDPSLRASLGDFLSTIGHYHISEKVVFNCLSTLALIILTMLFGYLFISFLNFSSQAILDFIPGVSSQALLQVIHVLLIIILAWILVKSKNFVMYIITSPLEFIESNGNNTSADLVLVVLVMLVIDAIFMIANTLLISKFFEAREKN
ncbi:hypothetical protein [Lactobacillus xylocopicola]|uniref:ABC transporter permease n=1 Tax=Lactobacillus xylocopicola TaxID=2976676 RepID=A0ABN6SLM0_9LACO|nr:hypothetical protein [Lactobacillus xylocopicola]BDR60523.1 hypothetical protein KIM322_07840 [Lactobacillus xylocopicola]